MSHEHHPTGWALVHQDWGRRHDDRARRASADVRPTRARQLVARLARLLRCSALSGTRS